MVSLEHVKLLEDRIIRTLDHVQHVQEENSLLREKLDEYKGRIDELEVLIKTFKDDQSKIEDGILAALDRLNQFEIAVERGLSSVSGIAAAAGNTIAANAETSDKHIAADTENADPEPLPLETEESLDVEEASDGETSGDDETDSQDAAEAGDDEITDIEMDLTDAEDGLPADTEDRKDGDELDIF